MNSTNLRCFICSSEKLDDKLSKVTARGYTSLQTNVNNADDAAILNRFTADWNNGIEPCLACHTQCRTFLFNKAKSVLSLNGQGTDGRSSQRLKRRRTTSDSITSGSNSTNRVLPYRQTCILCNEFVNVQKLRCYPAKARRLFREPDSGHKDQLKRRLMDTATYRGDEWGQQVIGRLSGINDLVAEEAVYHLRCRTMFETPIKNPKVGRPVGKDRELLFERLCVWIDENVDHKITTLTEVHSKMEEFDPTEDKNLTYTRKYLKEKLQDVYADTIYFTSHDNKESIFCFKNTTNAILRDYKAGMNDCSEFEDDSSLKELIIRTATTLILHDLDRVHFDNKRYPSICSMASVEEQLNIVPESLKTFLKPIVKSDDKLATWSQNLFKAYRPRSAIMPSQLGLTIQLDHKFGSKWLIDRLHRLGYCESYAELHDYKYCNITSKDLSDATIDSRDSNPEGEETDTVGIEDAIDDEINTKPFDEHEICDDDEILTSSEGKCNTIDDRRIIKQYVGDNIDLNVISVNGNTSFHAMGVIKVYQSNVDALEKSLSTSIPRRKLTVNQKVAALEKSKASLKNFTPKVDQGLSLIKLFPIKTLIHNKEPSLLPGDIAWAGGWIIKSVSTDFEHPNWNGFMKSIHKSNCETKSFIEFLPIINSDPNSYSTIYTTLVNCLADEQNPIVITFDLPLWMKATQIVLQCKFPIITRLGGFHLLKSYIGAVGAIMADTGLQEVIQLVYPGCNVSEHILSGGAYAKALRFHFLMSAAIYKFVMKDAFKEEELIEMERFIKLLRERQPGATHNSSVINMFKERIESRFQVLAKAGRTPALWVWYCERIELMKIFVRSERVGDHNGHLSSITAMLNTFAAAGHHHYAKAARLYVQLMEMHQNTPEMKRTVEQFNTHGAHVVRSSDHEWSGTWTDMTIESTLMREAKSSGGLSTGRFRNKAAHDLWVQSLNHFTLVNQELQHAAKDNQRLVHAELSKSQIRKDDAAVNAICGWFEEYNPFDEERNHKVLVSFSTGFTSISEDGVNADEAENVGEMLQKTMDGKTVCDPMSRKNKVKTLKTLRDAPKVNGNKLTIDSMKLFNRIIIVSERDLKTAEALKFELTPLPMSLFDKDHKLRKPNKANLAKHLKSFVNTATEKTCKELVIDGGWLLHNVKWIANTTWHDILTSYVRFVLALGSEHDRITVVFDGYESSTKDHDHLRRTKKASCDISIRSEIKCVVSREKFLDNTSNKTHLIHTLDDALKSNGIVVIRCSHDADTQIVKTAVDRAQQCPVEVKAEDTDVLVMLVHHGANTNYAILLTNSKGVSFDVKQLHAALPEMYKEFLICLHSFTGCDTVSAISGFGKVTALSKLCNSEKAKEHIKVFTKKESKREDVVYSGTELFKILYVGETTKSLEQLRFELFSKRATSGYRLNPERLPPTTGAAAQHSLRAYLQAQDWLLLQSPSLNVSEYGWRRGSFGYEPIPSEDPIAPEYLLKVISCNCEGDCSTLRCSCKKQGVKCITACGHCNGRSCSNIPVFYEENEVECHE